MSVLRNKYEAEVTVDYITNAAYVVLSDDKITRQVDRRQKCHVILDYAEDGALVGIEVLNLVDYERR